MTPKRRISAVLALVLCAAQLTGCENTIKGAVRQIYENSVNGEETESAETEAETETESETEMEKLETERTVQETEPMAEPETEPAETESAANVQEMYGEAQLVTLRQRIRQSSLPVGLAYIGYIGNDATEEELRQFVSDSAYAEPYSFLKTAPLVDGDGAELYAIVTMENCEMSVYPIALAEDGTLRAEDSILRKSDGEDCFLLRCNVSDIVPNIECSIKSGELNYTLSPMLSGKDGYLIAPGVCDFTIYPEDDDFSDGTDTMRTERDIEIATELLSEAAEVQERLGAGMTLLYTGEEINIEGRECMLFALGTDNGDQFVREYLYGVCDNLIYAYDALSDTWSVFGMG